MRTLLISFVLAAAAQSPDSVESALGWQVAIRSTSPVQGFRWVQVDSGQAADAAGLRRRLDQSGVRVGVFRVSAAPAGVADWQRAASAAQQLGATLVIAPPGTAPVPADLGVKVAVETGASTPEQAIATAERLHAAIWCDPAAWQASGTRPLAALYMLRGRLAGCAVPAGAAGDEFLKEAYRLDIKPLVWTVDPRDATAARKSLDALVQYHANYASRTGGVRRFGEITSEERAKIEAALPAKAPATPRKARRLLVFDLNVGRFGHPSIAYANLAMELMGRKTGAFTATVSSDPAILEPARLREFDAVFLNNTIGDIFSTAAARGAFASFVKNGGGVVANHAATVTATDWPEFGEILGARGASHRMTDERVTLRVEDPSHPVTRAFGAQSFEFADEFFRFQPPYSRDKVRVLLSIDAERTDLNQGRCYGQCLRDDSDYPVAWVRQYGKGRVFYTTLGHSAYVFWEPRMLSMFLAAIQYALGDLDADAGPRPNPAPDIDAVLRDLSSYKWGADHLALRRLDRAMGLLGASGAARVAEGKFIAFLNSGASNEAKGAVCRQLAIVGSTAAVPALAALLRTPALTDSARYALERIDGPDATSALRGALQSAAPREQAGLILSLGRRRDGSSIPALRRLLGGGDASLRAAAANALGMIGTPEAEAALLSASLDRTTADALLSIATSEPAAMARLYRHLAKGPDPIPAAALDGLARTSKVGALPELRAGLRSESPAISAVAIRHMAVLDARGLAAAMPQLPADRQVQALAALVHHDRAIARPLFLNASGSDVEAVRLSAIEGLAASGTAADVALLATRAATATGTEQAAARQALAGLPGEEVDSAIVSSLAGASGKQLIELIRAAGERGIGAAAPALIRAGESNDAAVRKAALKALKDVAPASDVPALLSMLPRCQEDDRSDCERALAHSLRRGAKPDVQAVAAAFAAQSSAEVRASLVNVLGTVALSDGLPTLRKALSAPEPEVRRAAVTALGEWPSADPVNDLIEAARSHSDAAIRVLALRGYVKLVRLPSERSAPETARLLAAAMQAASRPDEKKLVLAAAQRVPCPESLELAKAAAADPALAAEAKAARAAIETALKGRGN